ncbi:hypothetical protein CR513_40234, partial [Mucuna pruriens]
MAQQQPRRDEFGLDQRDYDVRDGDREVRTNDDEKDRWRDEYGSRVSIDPVANYAYGNIGSGGYGAPPTGGPYAGPNYGASGFEYSTAYGTTGTAPTAGYGTTAPGQQDQPEVLFTVQLFFISQTSGDEKQMQIVVVRTG